MKKIKIDTTILIKQVLNNDVFNKNNIPISLLYIFISIISLIILKNIFQIIKYQILSYDLLTQHKNMNSFQKISKNSNTSHNTLCILQLNNLKTINSIFGYSIGDKSLKEISKLLKIYFPKKYIFRVSGSEFYILGNSISFEKKLISFLDSCKSSVFFKTYNVKLTNSFYHKAAQESFSEAIEYVYRGLIESQNLGNFSYFHMKSEFILEQNRKFFIKRILEEAIDKEIFIVFQKKIHSSNPNKIFGAEALCRWINNELGFISPAEFIPIAEELNLIDKLDLKIAELGIQTLDKWLNNSIVPEDFKLSFNLSMKTLDKRDIYNEVSNLLSKYNISGKNIEIEITESLTSKNFNSTVNKINSLKELGISISLDDFTTGNSTITTLSSLPIDIVKFDKSLLKIYNSDKNKGTIVYKNLITLVKKLNLFSVAEGVETNEEYLFLKALGVEIIQGFYFGKPLIEKEFIENI